MKVKKQRTKKLRVVIIAIFLVIGVCGLVLLNGNTEIELSKFTAQGAKALGDSGEVVIGSWSMSASGGGNVRATLYEDGRLVISGTGTMKSFANAGGTTGTWHGLTESSNIKSIEIKEGIWNIGPHAFKGCDYVTSVKMSDDITEIGYFAFSGCSTLKDIVIPESVTEIGTSAFSGCSSLTEITIPDATTELETNLFSGCSSLEKIDISSTVTNIKTKVFSGCSSLKAINVDNNNTMYSSENGILFNKDKSTLILYPLGKDDTTNYLIPDTVTSINGYAFEECDKLTSVEISNSITDIGDFAFYKFNGLKEIKIPNTVLNIGEYAFWECINLENITIPNSAENIGMNAFVKCSSLKTVVLPNNLKFIDCLFSECTSLENVVIPDSVTEIDSYAFAKCPNLKELEIPDSVTKIGTNSFYNSKITVNVNSLEVMPKLLQRTQDENDILYTEEELELKDCIWNNNKDALIINGTKASAKVKEGALKDLTIEMNVNEGVDIIKPTINSVTGNTTEWTNQSVTLTINATDNESGIAEYSFDDGENWKTTNSKTYTANTSNIKIKVKDNAGNITPYGQTIKIDKIDNIAPTITITPNGSNTSQSKEVIINVVELGGSGLSNENSYQYQLGTSSTEVPTGTWQDYTNGTEFTIGDGLTGNYYIWVKNISDNAGNEAAELDYIVSNKFMFDNSEDADITVPELSVEYSTTQLTKESVTVTIKSNEEIQEVDGWTISEDDKTLTKVYTKNATENIDVYDIAGNKTTIQVKIENIDTTVPELSVEYSATQLTNQSVTVTIKSNEEIQEVDGWTISEDDKTLTKTYATNSNQNVDVYDIVGNKSTIQVKVENIDTTKPELSVEYDITQPTNKSVTATITANEQIQQLEGWTISEDGTTLTKIYTENTEKNIDVYDLAGNKSIVQVKITNIDKTEIKATVEYSTTILTNKNVIVKIISNKEIKEIDGWTLLEDKKTLTKEYAENSNEDVILQDLVGNEREIKISVQNIDKIAPKVDVEYSTLKQTNKSLTVTITANEDLKSLEGWTLEEYGKTLTKIYTKNTTENIDLYDLAGNKVTVKITINNIDTTLPNIEVKYSTTENTKEDVVVTIVSDEQLQEVDGWTISEDGKTLTKKYEKNVEETIKIYDIAGNEYEVQISVKNIDKTTTQKPEVEDTQNSEKPDTAPSRIPDAGSNTLIGIIIITIIVSIVLWIKNRKFKDIK